VADQVLPINQLDQAGVILDTPPVALPPNSFSNVRNIRFKDGAIKKMEGEVNIFPNIFDDSNNLINSVSANFDGSIIKYFLWWDNPNLANVNKGYYLIIAEEERLVSDNSIPPQGNTNPTHQKDIAYLVNVNGSTKVQKGIFQPTEIGNWQHTFFQGGFCLIINNGLDKPNYILDDNNNTNINNIPNFAELPGWDSYKVNQIYLQDTFNSNTDSFIFDLGKKVNFALEYIEIVDYDSQTESYTTFTAAGVDGDGDAANSVNYDAPDYSTFTGDPTVGFLTNDQYEIYFDSTTNSHIVFLPSNLDHGSHTDKLTISIRSRDEVFVRCGVIRSFGDFLVAGNLVERDGEDLATSLIVRNLNGVVRTSDAAAPGAVPNNWNPFAAGVSTADEFVLAETGIIQDMKEMQGNLYIYSNSSISVMRLTGNTSVPLSVSPVSRSYGCQTTDAVISYDGRHFVVGSQDIYVFEGHPGSIKSVSDKRVRRYFFDNLNPLHATNLFCVKYTQRDEIWICYPTVDSTTGECNEALIWNYRSNTWTIRDLRGVISGSIGPVPGGGLPNTQIDVDNISGDNGVIQLGTVEIRTIGIDNTQSINPDIEFYTGGLSDFIYGTGRNGNTSRVEVNNDRPMYEVRVYPTLTLTGPENISESFTITNPNADINTDEVTAEQIFTQLVTKISEQTGWGTNLPSEYTQLVDTSTNRIIAAEDDTNISKYRAVDNSAFNISLDISNSNIPNISSLDLDFQDSINTSSVHGIIKDSSNDYRGQEVLKATPTYLGLEIRDFNSPGNTQLIILQAGDTGTYDFSDHTGINGETLTAEEAATKWISELNIATPNLKIVDRGTAGEFDIQPANFSDFADFVIDVRVNNNQENADWIWEKYQDAISGTIGLNSNSATLFINDGDTSLRVASNSPTVAGTLDDQINIDPLRAPSRTETETTATMSIIKTENNVFDLDRPWATDEVNPNLEFPLFASKAFVVDSNGLNQYNMNKIVAADIGWSIPAFNYIPRTETENSVQFKNIITNNDEPVPYESFFERKQLAVSPEFDTETIRKIALWADGQYIPYVNSPNNFNRLQIRMLGTDNPGKNVDLTTLTNTNTKYNNFFVSEDYKVDIKANGRFLNYRISDVILDENNNELELTSNVDSDNSVIYNQISEWRISGMQPEISKGGAR